MSGLMAKLFGSVIPQTNQQPQQTSVQPSPGTPGNIPNPTTVPQSSPGTANNGIVPNTVPNEEKNKLPLDQFKTLWEPVKVEEGKQPITQNQNLDPDKLQELVSKANFSKVLSPETLSSIANGGEGAVEAFSTALNSVAQQVFMQATLASDKMLEQRLNSAMKAQEAKVQELVRQNQVSDTLNSKNSIFKDPAVAPVISALKSQLATKYPDATTTELTKMTEDYMIALAETFAPKSNQTNNPNAPKEQDWEKFLVM